MTSRSTPAEHLLTRISEALALDDRVGELGFDVWEENGPTGRRIVVAGHVITAARKGAVAAVVHDVLAVHGEDVPVMDRTIVSLAARPGGEGEVL